MSSADITGYARADAPRPFTFPADHGPHEDFQLEWWYWTGNLVAHGSDLPHRFGFQLTFFRQALAPPSATVHERTSAWATRQLYLAHFAVTDVDGQRLHAFERTNRGAAQLAGARATPFRVWVDDWQVEGMGVGALPMRLEARADSEAGSVGLELEMTSTKPVVLQGEDGLSRKGPEPGQASYYLSLTRLSAGGTLRLGDEAWSVEGEAWLDHEWSTGVLSAEAAGWDWLSLQLLDGRELMFFHLRLQDGTIEPASHGALVAIDGTTRHLHLADVELEATATWASPRGGTYPAAWKLRVPSAGLDLAITPLVPDQELDLGFRYWEGAIEARDAAGTVAGHGYFELVGYAE